MRQDRTCQHCKNLFPNEEGRVFANHVRWCSKNKTNGDKGVSKRELTRQVLYLEKVGEVKEFTMSCDKCQKQFSVREREKLHPEKEIYFCSRSCANSRGPRSEDFKQKVREKLSGRIIAERITKTCQGCNVEFVVNSNHPHQKCCSVECSKKIRYAHLDKTGLKYYRRLCSFNFNLADFPDEFDFRLIEQHGWYKATNRGNNLGGVSRDHIVSVKYGFENKIDPEIISHPANCRLLVHNENVSKGEDCGMSIEQLKQKIVEWNKKYNFTPKSLSGREDQFCKLAG